MNLKNLKTEKSKKVSGVVIRRKFERTENMLEKFQNSEDVKFLRC